MERYSTKVLSFHYSIDPSRRLVVLRPDAPPSLEDWAEVLDRVARDPAFSPDFGVLSDRRHLVKEPTADYAKRSVTAIEERSRQFPGTRFAILTSHLATYGMGRLAEAYAENRGIAFRVFTSEADAMEWLSSRRR